MTLDLSIAPGQIESTVRRQIVTYTGPALYATGGDPYTAGEARIGKLFAILGGIISNGTACLVVWWNPTTSKLMVFDMAGAEVAASTVLSGYTGRLEFVGQ